MLHREDLRPFDKKFAKSCQKAMAKKALSPQDIAFLQKYDDLALFLRLCEQNSKYKEICMKIKQSKWERINEKEYEIISNFLKRRNR